MVTNANKELQEIAVTLIMKNMKPNTNKELQEIKKW